MTKVSSIPYILLGQSTKAVRIPISATKSLNPRNKNYLRKQKIKMQIMKIKTMKTNKLIQQVRKRKKKTTKNLSWKKSSKGKRHISSFLRKTLSSKSSLRWWISNRMWFYLHLRYRSNRRKELRKRRRQKKKKVQNQRKRNRLIRDLLLP